MIAGEIAACLTASLVHWVDSYKLGCVFSHTGLRLPNQDIHAIGIAFIARKRLKYSPNYLEIAPDLVIEIRSAGESLILLQANIERCLELGSDVGILINPEERTVTEYCPEDEIRILKNAEILTLPKVLPGWELPVSNLWVPACHGY